MRLSSKFFLVVVICFTTWRSYTSIYSKGFIAQDETLVGDEIIQHLKLPPGFELQRVCIRPKQDAANSRSSLQNTYLPFLREGLESVSHQAYPLRLVDIDRPTTLMELSVPVFVNESTEKTEELLLGVATTLDRVPLSLKGFSRWLSGMDTTLVILITDQADLSTRRKDIDRIMAEAEKLQLRIKLKPHTSQADGEGLKNFALATVLQEECNEATKWIGIIDDDTFIVSLPNLLQSLSGYDPTLYWYIGSLTEGFTILKRMGYIAFGGAGMFLSRPLLEQVALHSQSCKEIKEPYGDRIWGHCILSQTNTKLTRLPGLNQVDIWKDLSGFYESGLNPLLTLHHWRSWHSHPLPMAHLVADVAGPDSFLQRYQFRNNIVLTNGYSVVEYPLGMPDLRLMELTMMEDKDSSRTPGRAEYYHSLGATRPPMKEGVEKITWKFEYAIKQRGIVRQFYVNRSLTGGRDRVIEIDWV